MLRAPRKLDQHHRRVDEVEKRHVGDQQAPRVALELRAWGATQPESQPSNEEEERHVEEKDPIANDATVVDVAENHEQNSNALEGVDPVKVLSRSHIRDDSCQALTGAKHTTVIATAARRESRLR